MMSANFARRVVATRVPPTAAFRSTPFKVQMVEGQRHKYSDGPLDHTGAYYALCDVPCVRDFTNRLSYSLVESTEGVLLFLDEKHLTVLRDHLELPHHVVEVTDEQLKVYREMINGNVCPAIVVFNSFSDIASKTSYFLYYKI